MSSKFYVSTLQKMRDEKTIYCTGNKLKITILVLLKNSVLIK